MNHRHIRIIMDYRGLLIVILSLAFPSHGERQLESKCVYDLFLDEGSVIQSGQVFQSPDKSDLFVEQRDDGKLVVKEDDDILWENGYNGPVGNYYTRLQSESVRTFGIAVT